MTTLAQLFANSDISSQLSALLNESRILNISFDGFCLNSKHIQAGNVFVVLKSAVNHDDAKTLVYAKEASNKASFILSEVDFDKAEFSVPIVYLPNIRDYLGSLYQAFLQTKQSNALPKVMAVTGTNGKTSIATLTAQLLQHLQTTALLGTAGNGIYPHLTPASHTTTDVLTIHNHLYDFASKGAELLCLEASSHGLHQNRLQGIPIEVAVYSNLSRDHLDYHHTMEEYAQAKSKLFCKKHFPNLRYAIINIDDAYADVMLAQANQSGLTIWTYGMSPNADFCIQEHNPHMSGINFILKTPFCTQQINSPLLGMFNMANLVASMASAMALGHPLTSLVGLIENLEGVCGRMQAHHHHNICYVVDYAHTPDAIEQVINSLNIHADDDQTTKLVIVFGCGGDRDKGKRPLMMQAALLADKVIVTSDNPRTEDPNQIIKDITAGLTSQQLDKISIETDRQLAIKMAIQLAQPNDMVLIAGKGHETYQEINGVRHDFDDMAMLKNLLDNL